MFVLKDIYFGNIDGTEEASRHNLLDSFYNLEDGYIEDITQNGFFIISGRKGTGKTLLAHYIKNHMKKNGYICEIKNLQGFKTQKSLHIQGNDFENGEEVLLWKWIILLEVARIILEKSSLIQKYSIFGARSKLYKQYKNLISKDGLIEKERTVDKGRSIRKSLNLKEIFGAEWSTVDQVLCKLEKAQYKESLEQLERKVLVSLKDLKILLIFDDLDELKINLSKNTEYQDIINGLIQAVSEINKCITSYSDRKGDLRCIVAIRDDIIDKIHAHSSNSNKKIAEKTIRISWRGGKTVKESPIIKMILKKARMTNEEVKTLTDSKMFEMLFEDEKVAQTILDSGFHRPRDIIKYLNIIKKEYPNKGMINEKMCRNCRIQYSNYFYNEIVNELSVHEEGSYNNQCLGLIGDYGYSIFRIDEIKSFYEKNKKKYELIEDVEESLKYLYSFGIVGNVKDVEGKKWYAWAYREDGSSELNSGLLMVVHKGLWKKLNLTGNSKKEQQKK